MTEPLRDVGAVLAAETDRQAAETDRWRAHAEAAGFRTSQPVVEGAELVAYHDGSSFRHRLAGQPVRNGDSVYLLTPRGWLGGSYETEGCRGGGPDRIPIFHTRLPGVGQSVSFRIPQGARLAWPEAFRQR